MTKKKVALLFGGKSVEHRISINSAKNIFEYIDKTIYEPLLIGIDLEGRWFLCNSVHQAINSGTPLSLHLSSGKFQLADPKGNLIIPDILFPVLHGTNGEDGSVQGLSQTMNIPCVGTGILGSSVSMSKLATKKLLKNAGVNVTKFRHYSIGEKDNIDFKELSQELKLPFIVKAANLGSSVGINKVTDRNSFEKALNEAFKFDLDILIEEFITGRELECAILGNSDPKASLPGEIIICGDYAFYTFEAKYVDQNAVRIEIPAKLDQKTIDQIRDLSIRAYKELFCEDYARVDLFLSDQGKVYVNEINTIPGFTNSSMFPMMWADQGINFTELISKILNFAFEKFEKHTNKQTLFLSDLDTK